MVAEFPISHEKMPTKPAGSTVLLALLGASVGVASSASAASTAARRLVEVTPAKGLMLMRTWQTRADTMNVLKTVPDGKTGKKLKVVSERVGTIREQMDNREFESACETIGQALDVDPGNRPPGGGRRGSCGAFWVASRVLEISVLEYRSTIASVIFIDFKLIT